MKGIIISHEDGGSYVLDKQGGFRWIKGHTGQPIGAEISFSVRPRTIYLRFVAAAAACLMLVASLGVYTWTTKTVSYYAYLDINPSIELTINRRDAVLGANALNPDGQLLLENRQINGDLASAVDTLVAAAKEEGYITGPDNAYIMITIASKDEAHAQNVLQVLQHDVSTAGLAAEFAFCDTAEREEAIAMGVSPGKLILAKTLYSMDPSVPVQGLVNLPVAAVLQSIEILEQEAAAQDTPKPPTREHAQVPVPAPPPEELPIEQDDRFVAPDPPVPLILPTPTQDTQPEDSDETVSPPEDTVTTNPEDDFATYIQSRDKDSSSDSSSGGGSSGGNSGGSNPVEPGKPVDQEALDAALLSAQKAYAKAQEAYEAAKTAYSSAMAAEEIAALTYAEKSAALGSVSTLVQGAWDDAGLAAEAQAQAEDDAASAVSVYNEVEAITDSAASDYVRNTESAQKKAVQAAERAAADAEKSRQAAADTETAMGQADQVIAPILSAYETVQAETALAQNAVGLAKTAAQEAAQAHEIAKAAYASQNLSETQAAANLAQSAMEHAASARADAETAAGKAADAANIVVTTPVTEVSVNIGKAQAEAGKAKSNRESTQSYAAEAALQLALAIENADLARQAAGITP